nr:hypothetical protein [Nanoarchaeota archaeon]
MFNKKLKNKIRRLEILTNQMKMQLFVDDYFGCTCKKRKDKSYFSAGFICDGCNHGIMIPKSEAIVLKIIGYMEKTKRNNIGKIETVFSGEVVTEVYTSKKNYKLHKDDIKKLEKEVADFKEKELKELKVIMKFGEDMIYDKDIDVSPIIGELIMDSINEELDMKGRKLNKNSKAKMIITFDTVKK